MQVALHLCTHSSMDIISEAHRARVCVCAWVCACVNNNGTMLFDETLSITWTMWHRKFCTPIIKWAASAKFVMENCYICCCCCCCDCFILQPFSMDQTRHLSFLSSHCLLDTFNAMTFIWATLISSSWCTLNDCHENAPPKITVFSLSLFLSSYSGLKSNTFE